jgi:hypothetical protein
MSDFDARRDLPDGSDHRSNEGWRFTDERGDGMDDRWLSPEGVGFYFSDATTPTSASRRLPLSGRLSLEVPPLPREISATPTGGVVRRSMERIVLLESVG